MLCSLIVYGGLVVSIVLLAVILSKLDKNQSGKVKRVGMVGNCNPSDVRCMQQAICDQKDIACAQSGVSNDGSCSNKDCVMNEGGECVSNDPNCVSAQPDPNDPNGGGRWSRRVGWSGPGHMAEPGPLPNPASDKCVADGSWDYNGVSPNLVQKDNFCVPDFVNNLNQPKVQVADKDNKQMCQDVMSQWGRQDLC